VACNGRVFHKGKRGRTPASGSLHRLVRLGDKAVVTSLDEGSLTFTEFAFTFFVADRRQD
jgi:hypothetical protein